MGPPRPLTEPLTRKFFFGYYIDSDILVSYASQYILEDHLSIWDSTNLWLLAMEMLGQEAGLRSDPQAELVIVDEDAEWEVGFESPSRVTEEVGTICAIMAICSNERWSLNRRPTQGQVDVISKALMQKPRWWECAGYE